MPQSNIEHELVAELLGFGDNTPTRHCNAYCATCCTGLHITGTGTYAKRSDANTGGVYFCTENCARAWDKNKLAARAATEVVAEH